MVIMFKSNYRKPLANDQRSCRLSLGYPESVYTWFDTMCRSGIHHVLESCQNIARSTKGTLKLIGRILFFFESSSRLPQFDKFTLKGLCFLGFKILDLDSPHPRKEEYFVALQVVAYYMDGLLRIHVPPFCNRELFLIPTKLSISLEMNVSTSGSPIGRNRQVGGQVVDTSPIKESQPSDNDGTIAFHFMAYYFKRCLFEDGQGQLKLAFPRKGSCAQWTLITDG